MCNRPVSTREHVPPLCFFPEAKDLPEYQHLRTNLITVPSCDVHNSAKSGDDQYLLSIVVAHHQTNAVGQRISATKLMRSLERKPRLAQRFFRGLFPVRIRGHLTGAFFVDLPRLERTTDQIARGTFYHHYGNQARGPSSILSSSLFNVTSPKRAEVNAALAQWRDYSSQALAHLARYGENQQVFYFQIVEGQDRPGVFIRLVFYEGVVIDVVFPDQIIRKPGSA
jgi:hypothetical protein